MTLCLLIIWGDPCHKEAGAGRAEGAARRQRRGRHPQPYDPPHIAAGTTDKRGGEEVPEEVAGVAAGAVKADACGACADTTADRKQASVDDAAAHEDDAAHEHARAEGDHEGHPPVPQGAEATGRITPLVLPPVRFLHLPPQRDRGATLRHAVGRVGYYRERGGRGVGGDVGVAQRYAHPTVTVGHGVGGGVVRECEIPAADATRPDDRLQCDGDGRARRGDEAQRVRAIEV